MRISDWSSDVCSSDLHGPPGAEEFTLGGRTTGLGGPAVRHSPPVLVADADARMRRHRNAAQRRIEEAGRDVDVGNAAERAAADGQIDSAGRKHRSEEHTSELQSLMRSSYAVFCLNKKNNN